MTNPTTRMLAKHASALSTTLRWMVHAGSRLILRHANENRPVHAGIAQGAMQVRIAGRLRDLLAYMLTNSVAGIAGDGGLGRDATSVDHIELHQLIEVVTDLLRARA